MIHLWEFLGACLTLALQQAGEAEWWQDAIVGYTAAATVLLIGYALLVSMQDVEAETASVMEWDP